MAIITKRIKSQSSPITDIPTIADLAVPILLYADDAVLLALN